MVRAKPRPLGTWKIYAWLQMAADEALAIARREQQDATDRRKEFRAISRWSAFSVRALRRLRRKERDAVHIHQ